MPEMFQIHTAHMSFVHVTDAGGEHPGGSDDRSVPPRSDYTDGTLRDGEPPEQVCAQAGSDELCLRAG